MHNVIDALRHQLCANIAIKLDKDTGHASWV